MNRGITTTARRFLMAFLVFLAVAIPVREVAAANVYTLDAPDQVNGNPGETKQFTARVLLTQSEGHVQGYVIGLTVSPAACSIVEVALGSGASEAELSVLDILTPDNSATCGVVMDFHPPYDGQTIPPVGPQDPPQELLRVTVAAPVPSDGSCLTCTLQFVDGLNSPPLDNMVVIGGLSYYNLVKNGGSTSVCGSVPGVPPEVNAGPDRVVECAALPCWVQLQGSAVDPDHAPSPLAIEWKVIDAPGSVTFDDPADPQTGARFSAPGVYRLALTASDGPHASADQVLITIAQGAPGPACDPVGHWNLDEGVGSLAHDVSGHGHDGTLTGDAHWVLGPPDFGAALALSGNGHVQVPHEHAFDATGTLTVAAWVNIEAIVADWTGIVTKGDSAWRLSLFQGEPRFHFAVADWRIGAPQIDGVIGVSPGQWHHVAGTYDGAHIRLYVNGFEDPAGPLAYSDPISADDYAVWLGDNAEVPGRGFVGSIDDVRIYNCALSQNEIQALMAGPGAGGKMLIREVIDNGPIEQQDACYASLESGIGTIVGYQTPVLNLWDSDVRGHFGDDEPFGVVLAGHRALSEVDDISLRVEGVIRVLAGEAGLWTFGVTSDDGFTLQLPGLNFLSVVNGELVDLPGGMAMRFFGGRAAGDTLGTIVLPAGEHPFWLTYHESWGGASVEFYAASGEHEVFDPEAFRLVGQPDIGVVPVPGFCGWVTMEATQPGAWSGGAIDSIADARDALAEGWSHGTNSLTDYPFINHIDPDLGGPSLGWFADDVAFANNVPGQDDSFFAVKVTGQLDIPAPGTYHLGFNSDDGAALRIPGRTWQSIVADETGHATIVGDELRNDVVTDWSFTAGAIDLPAGCHAFEAVMFDNVGGAFFELIGRGVSDRGIPDPTWHLLVAGRARAPVPVAGLQLVPIIGQPPRPRPSGR